MKTQTKWTVSDMTGAKALTGLRVNQTSCAEFQDKNGEWHMFDILQTPSRIIFGGYTNACFLESGYIARDGENLDETLSELLSDLEVYYNDGADYVSRIVCNERM